MAEWPDHFGDTTAEYLAFRDGAAVVDPGWGVVAVTGPDAVSFLDSLLSQRLIPGASVRTFLLGPRGKLRVVARAVVGDEEVLLTTDAGRVAALVEDLSRYRIRVKAEIGVDARPVRLVAGAGIAGMMGTLAPPTSGWTKVDDTVVADTPIGPFPAYTVVGTGLPDGLVDVGSLALTARRIEAGEPVMDVDVDEGTIPQETGLVAASVDFTKGCYLGQELVARIDTRGHVNRRLVGVVVGTNVLPPVGATVTVGGTGLGVVTSVGESLDLRAPVALATVRREAEDGATVDLVWDGGSAPGTLLSLPMVG